MQLSPGEILLVAIVALIVLGPERLPKAARQLGSALREFKKMSGDFQSQVDKVMKDGDFDFNSDKKATDDIRRQPGHSDEVDTENEGPNPPNPDVEGFKFVDSPIPYTPPNAGVTPPPPPESRSATDETTDGAGPPDEPRKSNDS